MISAKVIRVSAILLFTATSVSSGFTAVWHVDGDVAFSGGGTSWETAFKTIQEGVDAASDGDEIIVLPGIYSENFNFRGKAITIRSLDPTNLDVVASTIISTSSGPVVRFENSEGLGSVLEGLTIESESDCAIFCENSSPLIRSNVITCATGNGISSEGGSPEIRDNTITACSTPIRCDESSALIIGNNIVDNEGGVLCYRAFPTIMSNYIARNQQAAVRFMGAGGCGSPARGFARIIRNTVVDNQGTGIACHGWFAIEGNTVMRNGSSYSGTAGGIHCTSYSYLSWITGNLVAQNVGEPDGISVTGEVFLVNNTVVNNGPPRGKAGNGYRCRSRGIEFQSDGVIANCVIWGHDEDLWPPGTTPMHSCFADGGNETGSISDDPMFVNPAAGDYHLLPASPCRGAGRRYPGVPHTDIDLEPFPPARMPDIGADQFTDTDGDLMPDYWEVRQSGTTDMAAKEDADNDGLTNLGELLNRSVWNIPDTDGDGLLDGDEVHDLKTDPNNTDTDGDGMPDGWEFHHWLSPTSSEGPDGPPGDPDADGLTNIDEFHQGTDPQNPDTDSDGLTDGQEVNVYSTLPTNADTDGDGLADGLEVHEIGTDANASDTDSDGLTDGEEVNFYSTLPTLPDTDGDGLNDGFEVHELKTDPNDIDTDKDGLNDAWEFTHQLSPTSSQGQDGSLGDPDTDGLSNIDEFNQATDPQNPDTDGDGLTDGEEIHLYSTLATNPDTDGDGLDDRLEVRDLKTDPNDIDTDDDGKADGVEVFAGTDPLDSLSLLRLRAIGLEEGGLCLRITWSAVAGRTYRLHFSTDLVSWQPTSEAIFADGAVATVLLKNHPSVRRRFFRVEVLP